MEENLTESASDYANFAENSISELQQAYLKKYYPRQYSHPTQNAPNNRPGGKKLPAPRLKQRSRPEDEPTQSDDGICNICNICPSGSLNQTS